ncbi:MAG: hypothetical protein U0Z26_11010 [Anaerolineales bacterium]
MDQTIVQHPKSKNNKFWIGCLVVGLLACVGVVVLAGGAYYFGFFPTQALPVLASATSTEAIVTEQAATETVPTSAAVEATELPQVTATLASVPPKVEPYDLTANVQYPALASLAADAGNVSILPNQPTILEMSWCAKGESTLSKMTSLLDLTVLINDVEVPVSSFNISQYQTVLEITTGKKETALCNRLVGLVRNWSEGSYTVKLSLRATAAYNDGWKDHPAEVLQDLTYAVNVTPSASAIEWGRCQLFENLKTELVILDPKPKEPLGFYIKFDKGVPGLETPVSGDTGDWQYTAMIDKAVSDKACIFQAGYEGRLYCKVQLLSNYAKTIRPVSLLVNGCSWPVYFNPDAEIP